MSLWPAPAKDRQDLMVRLQRRLEGGDSPSTALAKARKGLNASGFICVGDVD